MTSVAKLVAAIPRSQWGWLFEGVARPPAVIWVPALVIAALLLTAPFYLVLRTLGAGSEAIDLIFRARTLEVVARTVALMAAVMLGCIAIAAPLAWLTVRTDLPARGFWRVVTMLPLALPSYIVGFAIAVGLGPRGILQGWLEAAFGPLSITIDRIPSIYGFPGAAFTLIIISFPYVLLPIRAALWNMDTSLDESARALGRTRWQTFQSVTLPMLRPAILAGGLLTALYALSDFGAVALMRYETFTWSIFIQYDTLNRTLAAAWSLGLIALALAVVWGEHAARAGFRNRGGGRYYLSGSGAARLPEPIPLGPWRWPALAYCSVVALASLGLPVAVLIYWTVRGVAAGEPLLLLWKAAANSVGVSALAAVLTVLCATPIAVLAVRYPGQFSRWLERLGFVGFALPGIVIALGLGLFRRQLRPMAVPVAGHAGSGVRHAVPAGCGGILARVSGTGAPGVRGRRPQPRQVPADGAAHRHAAPGSPRHADRRGAGVSPYHEGTARNPDIEPHRLHHVGILNLGRRSGGILRPRRRACPAAGGGLIRAAGPDHHARRAAPHIVLMPLCETL